MVANKIKKIAVFGPGMMGHAIAQEFAQAGYGVTLCGRSEERLQEALQKIERNLRELAQWDIMPEENVKPTLERIRTSPVIKESYARSAPFWPATPPAFYPAT
jgi:3-hydroxybutyryl-CoA dehydrogenase